MPNNPASSGNGWIVAIPLLILAAAGPAIIVATAHGRARTTGLLICIGVELLLAAGIGLAFRFKGRA